MKKLKDILFESPDTIHVISYNTPKFKKAIKLTDDAYMSILHYRDTEAHPFIFHNNVMEVGGKGQSHYVLDNYSYGSLKMDGSVGRIWTQSKVISSWGFPNKKDLMVYIKQLNKKGFNINNDWFLQISVKHSEYLMQLIMNNKDKIFIVLMNIDTQGAKQQFKSIQKGKFLITKVLVTLNDLKLINPYIDYNFDDSKQFEEHMKSPLMKDKDRKVYQKFSSSSKKISNAEYNDLKTKYKYTEQELKESNQMKSLKNLLQQANQKLVIRQEKINPNIYNIIKQCYQANNKQFRLDQAIKMFKKLQNILTKQFQLDIPQDVKDIQQIQLTDDNKQQYLKVINGGRKQQMKIGKIILKMFPDLENDVVVKITDKIKTIYKTNTFEMNQDNYFEQYTGNITKWYDIVADDSSTQSCMTGKRTLTKFYDNNKDVSIIIRYVNGKPYGRALLWTNVEGNPKKYYMDRTYPSSDNSNHNQYVAYAEYKDYNYRTEMGYDDYNCIAYGSRLSYNVSLMQIQSLPYLDTFRFYNKATKTINNFKRDSDDKVCSSTTGVRIDQYYPSQFQKACINNDLQKVKQILKNDTQASSLLNHNRFDPLTHSILNNKEQLFMILINHPSIKLSENSYLMDAISVNNENIINTLLSNKNIAVNDNILNIIKEANHKILKLLFKNEKINNILQKKNVDNIFFDIFEKALMDQDKFKARLITKHKLFNPNLIHSQKRMNCLMPAVYFNNTQFVDKLLKTNIDVNHKESGGSALHQAIVVGNLKFVKKLLQHPDIDVNLKDRGNLTPLMLANNEQVRKRLSNGKTVKGFKPQDMESIKSLIQKHKGFKPQQNKVQVKQGKNYQNLKPYYKPSKKKVKMTIQQFRNFVSQTAKQILAKRK